MLAALALLFLQPLPAAIPNAGFDRGLAGWETSGVRGFRASPGSDWPGGRSRWLSIGWAARSRAPDDAAFRVSTRIDARPYRGRRLRISAATRIRGEGAAVLFAAGTRAPLAFSDDWRRQGVVLRVPRDARELLLGFDVTASVRLDADEVRLEVLR